MATTKNSLIEDEDLQSWYTSLNTIISNYGPDTINQLSVPADNEEASASHINDFLNKITEMKQDEYLGSIEEIYPSYSLVNKGDLILSNIGKILEDSVGPNYLGRIKCRNKAIYSHGACSHGTNSHGTNSHGTNFLHAKKNGYSNYFLCRTMNSSDNTHFHVGGFNTHGMYTANATCPHTTCSYTTCTHSTNSHGGGMDILNSKTTA